MIYIIGCGGIGSWLSTVMAKLIDRNLLVLCDGDTLEEKNLDRQLFDEDQIGQNKAMALAAKLGIRRVVPNWYSAYENTHTVSDWLMCCVDNNPARKEVLSACDLYECNAIVAANEVHSSEAYFYNSRWKDTPLDPRTYYPEIIADTTGNPAARAAGCTGEAQEQNRQLVTANYMASALASHLFVVWAMEAVKVSEEVRESMPHRLTQNLSRNGYVLSKDGKQTKGKE